MLNNNEYVIITLVLASDDDDRSMRLIIEWDFISASLVWRGLMFVLLRTC